MFLQPHHFQQQDRYLEHLINNRCLGLQPFNSGFYTIKIDTNLLKIGKLALAQCIGVLPDGTPFNLPGDDDLPLPLDVTDDVRNEMVLLAVPLRRPGSAETDSSAYADGLARFRADESEVKDNNCGTDGSALLQIGKLRSRLVFQSEERSGYTCLGIAKIVEVRTDKNIVLDENFIPPNLNCIAIPILSNYLRQLHGLLSTRGEAISARVAAAGHGGVAEVADFLVLQLVNRYQPLFEHLATVSGIHPEYFYRVMIQLAGELATFFRPEKRPAEMPAYDHGNLAATFKPLMEELRELLGRAYLPTAQRIALSKPKYGVYAAKRPELNLLQEAVFVLAAKAQVPSDALRSHFPQQIKVGPVEEIQQLVNSALPGLSIEPLPVAPRQIPFHVGFTYFELNKHNPIWDKMVSSGGFAFFIGGNFPGLELEFWAIRKG